MKIGLPLIVLGMLLALGPRLHRSIPVEIGRVAVEQSAEIPRRIKELKDLAASLHRETEEDTYRVISSELSEIQSSGEVAYAVMQGGGPRMSLYSKASVMRC